MSRAKDEFKRIAENSFLQTLSSREMKIAESFKSVYSIWPANWRELEQWEANRPRTDAWEKFYKRIEKNFEK